MRTSQGTNFLLASKSRREGNRYRPCYDDAMPSSHLKLATVPSRMLTPLFTNGKTEWLNNLPEVTQSERRGAGIYKCLSLSDFRNHRVGLMSLYLPGLLWEEAQ